VILLFVTSTGVPDSGVFKCRRLLVSIRRTIEVDFTGVTAPKEVNLSKKLKEIAFFEQ
jgi:hypothetical protein